MAVKADMELNPADLKVDDSLPAYPMVNMLQMRKEKPTDKEVEEGKPLRLAAREKVLGYYNGFLGEQRTIKKHIETSWNKESAEGKKKNREAVQRTLDIFNKNPVYLDSINSIKKELVWWNNNIELSPREVKKRDLEFDESISKKIEAVREVFSNQQSSQEQKTKSEEEKEKAAKEALLKRTLYDDITDSASVLAKSLFMIFYILVGLRCASFAANECLYKPVPYRVIVFVYTFIFCPIFAPYYLWKVIQNYIWGTALPLYEGLLPIIPYDSSELLTLNRRLFGYADTPSLQQWIKGKQDAELEARTTAVISKNIKADIIQEHNE
jgi:hypothetical protein